MLHAHCGRLLTTTCQSDFTELIVLGGTFFLLCPAVQNLTIFCSLPHSMLPVSATPSLLAKIEPSEMLGPVPHCGLYSEFYAVLWWRGNTP